MKTKKAYAAYVKALTVDLSKKPVKWLAVRLALEIVDKEMVRPDIDAEYAPRLEAARKKSDAIYLAALERVTAAHSKVTEEVIAATKAGIGRKQQLSDWGKRGNAARRKYTDADKARWKKQAATPELNHISSKRRRAKFIADNEKLPSSAIESIRKAI